MEGIRAVAAAEAVNSGKSSSTKLADVVEIGTMAAVLAVSNSIFFPNLDLSEGGYPYFFPSASDRLGSYASPCPRKTHS